jgi:hypothetical protein
MRGTRVPAIVSSDFRPGTEGVGRLGASRAHTSTTTRNRESAPARTELGGHAGSLRMPTAAAARYRRPSARASSRASSAAAHYGSPPRYLGASCDACAPRYPRVRSCRSAEATGTPRKAGASGYEKMPSTCQRLRVDQLLERTWVSSTDQAPANARNKLRADQMNRERRERSGKPLVSFIASLDRSATDGSQPIMVVGAIRQRHDGT